MIYKILVILIMSGFAYAFLYQPTVFYDLPTLGLVIGYSTLAFGLSEIQFWALMTRGKVKQFFYENDKDEVPDNVSSLINLRIAIYGGNILLSCVAIFTTFNAVARF